ncbi:hypothetical protein [Saccharothrix hoggarensis]|uniref:Uncharacterized protein n=1 Tax=Saccharothrix hoggarensis TaxID=913853 RepID=A0ABW3R522_9PSEU
MAELIRKQPTPLRIPPCEHVPAHVPPVDPLAVEPPRAARSRATRAAKLAGVATGAIGLLASVAAASVLAGNRPAGPGEASVQAPAPINGSSALRPDVLSAELGGGQQPVLAPVPVDEVLPPAAAPSAAGSSVVPPPSVAVGPEPQVDVVRRFYELLPAKPADASRLLSPDLLGGDAHGFVSSWGQVQAITIESAALRPDGAVVAVVSMQERTGRWMRVEQVFWLTDTTVPRIVATEVLSAQRS